ncbi:ADP-heptose--LPS heptosyltransferase 2 [subsurface metagenome]
MGDAILCTPALRAIRQHFKSCKISFFAKPAVRKVLSPGSFNDSWLEQRDKNPFAIAKMLKRHRLAFTHAILFKNSFASGLAVSLARIPVRIGYAREGRGLLLTDKLYPPKLSDGKFKPLSMIDYYLAIASWLGADTTNKNLELLIDPQDQEKLKAKLPEVTKSEGLIVIIVPGGAFGPSKCWLSERFAQTADWLITDYNATVVVSVASNPVERQIAGEVCNSSKHKLVNLAESPVTLGELKALFSIADLVISNDTGPRHIAIALGRKIISLFGPNNPAWTDTGCENEIQIVGDVSCAPCSEPICKKKEHLCMQAITVEMVCGAAKKLLEKKSPDKQRL